MSSLVYAGYDLGAVCAAEVAEPCAHVCEAQTMDVPGRAGALLVGGAVAPSAVRVRLFLRPGFSVAGAAASELRRALRAWLCAPEGAELQLPDEPGLTWRDAVLTEAGEWTGLRDGASCEVEFTLYDPVAYGRERRETGESFTVGGTWDTWPSFELTAEEGDCVTVACGDASVTVEGEFAGGEAVCIGCEDDSATIDGEDARAAVTLGSDFFALSPGECELSFSGCSAHACTFSERWL